MSETPAKVICTCGHFEYKDGHCAEMSCSNYVNKHLTYKPSMEISDRWYPR